MGRAESKNTVNPSSQKKIEKSKLLNPHKRSSKNELYYFFSVSHGLITGKKEQIYYDTGAYQMNVFS